MDCTYSNTPIFFSVNATVYCVGGIPGLVVMGGDSCAKGCEFKSWHHILDGHFFTYLFVVKFVMLFEKTKINKKRLGLAHLFKEVAGQKSS